MATAAPATRPGGRSARVRAAVLDATLVEVAEGGVGRLSIEAVAARAGVHKTTVYRRWPTREVLLVEALLARSAAHVPVPDTGSIRGDLRALAHAIVANITSPTGSGVARALVDETAHTPAIRDAALAFWRTRFDLVGVVIARAKQRGELPKRTDADFLIEQIIGPLYLRLLVTHGRLDNAYANQVVDFALAGATAG
jgi:AcrR family transcriptional regulator